MKVILHIGMNKTGSSSIQDALFKNRTALKQRGVLYPETGLGDAWAGSGYHYRLSKALGFSDTPRDVEAEQRDAVQLKKALLKEAEEEEAQYVILSSEYFSQKRDMRAAATFFEGMTVRVVVYLRRHDSWLQSLYAQALKSVPGELPWQPGFDGYVEWVQRHRHVYQKFGELLDAWSSALQTDEISVRPFEKESMYPSIIEDFFFASGIQMPDFMNAWPTQRVNVSPRASELMRLEKSRRNAADSDVPLDTDPETLVSPELKTRLLSEQAEDYEGIAKRYLPERNGRLFLAS